PSTSLVLVDEANNAPKREQLCLLLRFCGKGIIQERAQGCFHMENLNAESVSKMIIEKLQHLKLDINYIFAQCYDGASVLSGHLKDIQARIQERITHAIYGKCCPHRLNLVIAD
ncbi:zinc finger MYM-type containing 1, partial [Chelydra serpentina]